MSNSTAHFRSRRRAVFLVVFALMLTGVGVVIGLLAGPRQGTTAAWVEAIGSCVAALGTVAAVGLALFEVFRERQLTRVKERRSQAQLVAAVYMSNGVLGPQGSPLDIDVINNSQEPIYDVVVWAVFVSGAAPHTGEEFKDLPELHTASKVYVALPPGTWQATVTMDTGVMGGRIGGEVGFTDRAGIHWIRRAHGALEEAPTDAVEHYSIGRPAPYDLPIRSTS
jgi:hypothetical protein